MNIEKLSLYATDRQKEILIAIQSEGSENKAAALLGVNPSTVNKAYVSVKNKAAMSGWSPEHDMTHEVPDGFKLKGTSTLYDSQTGQAKIQWVKTNADQVRQDEIFKEALEGFADAIPRSEPIKAPKNTNENLLSCYPVGDHHFGQYSNKEECGTEYTIEIASKLLHNSVDYLVDSAPPSSQALIMILGDLLHQDNHESLTPQHKNLLDSDGRYHSMVRAAIVALRYMIMKCLNKHNVVNVIVEIGNHDISSSTFMMECLHALYEDEPRVIIDRSPSRFHYFSFGKVLIATHHGDKVKKAEHLALLMATDRPKGWAASEFRYWYLGHIHHDSVSEAAGGVRCESMRVLAPLDAHAHSHGYRSGRDQKMIVHHKDFGEVSRVIFNPSMLKEI